MTQSQKTKVLWIKDEHLEQILDSRKTIEVRVGYSNILSLEPGDRLLRNDQYPFLLKRIAVYSNFEKLVGHEDAAAIAPDLPADQLLPAIRAIYPPEKEALEAVALEVSSDEN